MVSLSKKNEGFTLIELAIVFIILGLLIGGAVKGAELAGRLGMYHYNEFMADCMAENTKWSIYRERACSDRYHAMVSSGEIESTKYYTPPKEESEGVYSEESQW